MSRTYRLAEGGRIDRDQSLGFTFNGTIYRGYKGDTLASALLANGVRLVGRSFKYHRPRGVVGAGAEEPNAILQIGTGARTVPNLRATQVELYDGLSARSINAWPSLARDFSALTGKVSSLVPAGFYYKTFMWPARAWPRYEHLIRKAAGLGLAPAEPDPDRYEKTNVHCDVLIAGAGPAGLAAALTAGRAGARVIVADEQSELGGSLLASTEIIDGKPAGEWLAAAVKELASMAEVTLLPRSTVTGYYDHNFVVVNERAAHHLATTPANTPRERLWRVRARQVVLATGAIERPLVFGNNDLPGVMLASAVSCYVNRYAVMPGQRAVLFTNNDAAYQTAIDLQRVGVAVQTVVDARPDPRGALPNQVRELGITIQAGSVVGQARGGRRGVAGVDLLRLDPAGENAAGTAGSYACDLVAVSGGFSPAVHLHAQSGGRAVFDQALACFVPGESVQAERSAGAARGVFSLRCCLQDGFTAGAGATRAAGFDAVQALAAPLVDEPDAEPLRPLWLVPAGGGKAKRFVDYQNDTTAADIELAAREGFRSIEHVKRYTALGFGTDQGKLGNINGMAILARSLGQTLPATGTTTFRPNYTPVTFGAVAGRDLGATLFDPVRKTAIHGWHVEQAAIFENVGQWKRPWYYPKDGETLADAVNRECLAVRNGVGIMDASTLGKIDIVGPDAAEFLNRIYTNAWLKLAIGRCRYGLMLGEDGMVMDDGVTSRLATTHYHMTTTTGGAAHVLAQLERWRQTEWPAMKVYFTSVTDHWAVAAVVGPDSRKVVEALAPDIDFEAENFPFMSFVEGTVAGVPARVFRISFSGELAYEINVGAHYGRHVWEALMAAGAQYNITPYGTETMHVLRAEKGFIIVGQDTDGSMTPVDLGMQWIVSKTKDFIGRRSLARADCVRDGRKQLVGLATEDSRVVLPEGGQLVDQPSAARPVPMLGHVTSSYWSACLDRSIALAVVKGGHARMGETIYASLLDGRNVPVRIVNPVFYDPEGARQNV